MTDAQVREMLRPHVVRLVEALKAKGRTFAASDPDATEVGAFPASAAKRFSECYGCDDEGRYPGAMHTYFGCSAKTFAEVSGLKLADDGRGGWCWVKPRS